MEPKERFLRRHARKASPEERLFRRYVRKASPDDIPKIDAKLPRMKRGPVAKIWDKVEALWKLIKDPDVAWQHKALAIGALIYLISPVDAVPDVIPVVGLADDAVVIIIALSLLAEVLKKVLEKVVEKRTECEVRKHYRIVLASLLGTIGVALISVMLKLVWNYIP